MDKLSAKKTIAVVRQYFSGLSYDEIAAATGVSKGAVAGIVSDLKAGKFPEVADLADQVELLRELALDLKKAGLAPGQCAVGLAVLHRVYECGLDVADIERWPVILKLAGNDDEAKQFVDMVYHIQDVEKEMGVPLHKIDAKVSEMKAKATQLEPTLKKVEALQHEIVELSKQRDTLVPEVSKLEEKYAWLNPKVNDLQKRQSDLVKQIKQEELITASTQAALATWSKENTQLNKSGFNLDTLLDFNEKCRAIAVKHHITLSAVRDRLLQELKHLDQGLGLETLLNDVEIQLKKEKDSISSAKNEVATLNATIVTLKEQKSALDGSIKATTLAVSEEIKKIVPHAKDIVEQVNGELKHGAEEAVAVVQQVKDQALEAGKEIGRYKGIIESNQWMVDLVSLTKGDDNLEAKRVRAVLMLVMRGAQPWMKNHEAQLKLTTLKGSTDLVVLDLERWQV